MSVAIAFSFANPPQKTRGNRRSDVGRRELYRFPDAMSLSSEPETLFAFNRIQLSIALACFCCLMLVLIFPPWRQTHDGHSLNYKEHLGHHALWSAPSATGEDSWILKVSPSQCKVTINWGVLMAQCAVVVVIGVILCFVFRGIPTRRTLIYASLLLALCVPVPPADGIPLLVWVVGGVLAPLSDTGHFKPFDLFLGAIAALALCSAAIFAVLNGLVWLANRRSD